MSAHNELTKNRLTYLIVALILILSFAVFVVAWHLKNNGTANSAELHVTLQADGETKQTLEFAPPALIPGESTEYALHVRVEETGNYALRLEFEEEDAALLKDFITVEVDLNGERVASNTLARLFSGESFYFNYDFVQEAIAIVNIRYVLSAEATDETQGATADFDVELTAVKG